MMSSCLWVRKHNCLCCTSNQIKLELILLFLIFNVLGLNVTENCESSKASQVRYIMSASLHSRRTPLDQLPLTHTLFEMLNLSHQMLQSCPLRVCQQPCWFQLQLSWLHQLEAPLPKPWMSWTCWERPCYSSLYLQKASRSNGKRGNE